MDLLPLSALVSLLLATCPLSPVAESILHNSLICKDCMCIASRDGVCDLENSMNYQLCRCDSDCAVFGDCCLSTSKICFAGNGSVAVEIGTPKFTCESIILGNGNTSALPGPEDQYWMVSSCSMQWSKEKGHSTQEELDCKSHSTTRQPVTDPTSGLVYRNEYCALCNYVSNYTAWDHAFTCLAELRSLLNNDSYILTADDFNSYCEITRFIEPSLPASTTPARACYPQIDTCLDLDSLLILNTAAGGWNSSYYNEVKKLCMESHFQNHLVQDGQQSSIPYRNEHCSLCNGADTMSLECFLGPPTIGGGGPGPGLVATFIILLDVFGNGRVAEESALSKTLSVHVSCSEGTEVYDPVIMQCRFTVTTPTCNDSRYANSVDDNCIQCSGELISLMNSTLYAYTNIDTLLYREERYTVEYNTSEGYPVICVHFSTNGTQNISEVINFYTFTYPQAYLILTYIGCPLSVVGCLLTILTFALFKELRTLPSKILIQLSISILIGNLLILISGPLIEGIEGAEVLCKPSAILTHYVFLAQFSWMCIMSTEIARNLYHAFRMKTSESKAHRTKLLVIYTLTGWCVPLFIVTLTVIINFTTTNLVLYGELEDGTEGPCWINHGTSLLISFILPVAISLLYNAVIFIFVTIYLCASSHSQFKVTGKNKMVYLRLNLANFSVTGLTWVFGFIALLPQLNWAWIPYIIFNSTQGLAIFLAFLCTKRVAQLYRSLLFPKKGKKSTESVSGKDTQLNSLKGSIKSNEPFA